MAKYRGKKGKKSFEGEQYRGGRTPGRKNLKRVDGGFQNQHGVTFTEEQKKALERAVNRSNYQRKKMLEHEAKQPHIIGGVNTGHSRQQLLLMGKESDFIISRQSKSLQRFKSMADYESFMVKQEKIQSGEYLDDRTRLYKRNYMKALDNAFGDDAKDVKMKVRMMKPADFRAMVERDELAEIGYIYDPSAKAGKLNQIRATFNMKEKEPDMEIIDE